jgi:hypothetical protein
LIQQGDVMRAEVMAAPYFSLARAAWILLPADLGSDQCRSSTTDPKFDAYVSGEGQLQMIGTTRARYEFQKCMTSLGQGLRPRPVDINLC